MANVTVKGRAPEMEALAVDEAQRVSALNISVRRKAPESRIWHGEGAEDEASVNALPKTPFNVTVCAFVADMVRQGAEEGQF